MAPLGCDSFGGEGVVSRQIKAALIEIQIERLRLLGDLIRAFDADPRAAVARHRDRKQAEVEQFAHIRGIKRRD
jgi:hypothetical protein